MQHFLHFLAKVEDDKGLSIRSSHHSLFRPNRYEQTKHVRALGY